MKRFITISLSLVFGCVLLVNSTSAQSPAVQEAFEDVEDQVEDLVVAKDEGQLDDLALRIATFKKVVELSVSEAKDLKIKLLSLDQVKETASSWREERINNLNQALVYYDEQQQLIEDYEIISLETIKSLASDFKNWRERTYLPVAEQVNEFLLIKQEQDAIEIAKRRWQRIDKDITKLEESNLRGVAVLRELLESAGEQVDESVTINTNAQDLFFNRYIFIATSTEEEEESYATSSQTSTTTIDGLEENQPAHSPQEILDEQPDATSTEVDATSTEPLPPPLSIKDLVKDSLAKIKEAYRIFIEMSNLVRELLS